MPHMKLSFSNKLLDSLHFLPSKPVHLFCDNDAASCLSKDHIWHSHAKHICVKYHYTWELIMAGDLTIQCVGSKENTADIFTKPLARVDFQ